MALGAGLKASVVNRTVLRSFRCSDNPLDIFEGYVLHNGARMRSCRRWFGQGPGKFGEWLNSRVVLGHHELDYGDDPRVFSHQGNVCLVANVFDPEHGFRNHLIEWSAPGQWQRYFLMPPLGMLPGKNWTPFEFPNGRLGFIHSFSPLVILAETRREGGIILLTRIAAPGIPAEEGDGHGFPAHRGGTNGVVWGKEVVGVGHTTRVYQDAQGRRVIQPGCGFARDEMLIHRPFLWRLDLETLSMQCSDLDHAWDPRFFIVDPTSLIADPWAGTAELYTTEVERSFIDPTSAAQTVRYDMRLERTFGTATA